MKQDAEQENSLLYWEIQDDTTRKHQSLKQTLFFLLCFLMAGFGLYQMVKETPVVGVGSMNELEVGSVNPHYELESEVGAALTVNGPELGVGDENRPGKDTDCKDGDDGKIFFHNEFFDAEDLCEGYNCGPDEGSCLLLPKGDGSPSCIVDQRYLTKIACDNDNGVWCENIYRDDDVVDGVDDSEDEEDEVVEGVNPLELSDTAKEEQFKLVPGVEAAVGGHIGGKDWCDCGKKGDLQITIDGRYSHFVKPDGQWRKIELRKKVYEVFWRCTGGGGWGRARFAGYWRTPSEPQKSLRVRFKHNRKNCPSKWRKKRSGRIYWG